MPWFDPPIDDDGLSVVWGCGGCTEVAVELTMRDARWAADRHASTCLVVDGVERAVAIKTVRTREARVPRVGTCGTCGGQFEPAAKGRIPKSCPVCVEAPRLARQAARARAGLPVVIDRNTETRTARNAEVVRLSRVEGLTQVALAQRFGISQATVSNILRDGMRGERQEARREAQRQEEISAAARTAETVSRSALRRVQDAERREKVKALRLLGYSMEAIALELGLSRDLVSIDCLYLGLSRLPSRAAA